MQAEDEQVRRAKEVMMNMPKAGPSDTSGLRRSKSGKILDSFKVPKVPTRVEATETVIPEDVFGSTIASIGKGKTKEVAQMPGSSELEKANKTVSRTLCYPKRSDT